eukprot:EG_transcript_7886
MTATATFTVPEYQPDGTFAPATYEFAGATPTGWAVTRNGAVQQRLGPGYRLLRTESCTVCSTDLARRFLPYPLPAITGHEILARDEADQLLVVEINASHAARGLPTAAECAFCRLGIPSHCPQRITTGINCLPGGFAPWLLAPVAACVPVPKSVDSLAACLTEPLAAALQGVEATAPVSGESVAVVGPRRLGMLLLVALHGYRKQRGLTFTITAVGRHAALLDLAKKVGADEVVNTQDTPAESLTQAFDVVYDTTGKPEGLELCLRLARRVLHLKSTNGMPVLGMAQLSNAVVEELALLPFSTETLKFDWPGERSGEPPSSRTRFDTARTNRNVYASPTVPPAVREVIQRSGREVHTGDLPEFSRRFMVYDRTHPTVEGGAAAAAEEPRFEDWLLPRFDLAVVTTLAEADAVIRPLPGEELAAIRPRGAILLVDGLAPDASPLFDAVAHRGLEVHTSRCGDFQRALELLDANPALQATMRAMVTHHYPLADIAEAFAVAADSSQSIKVLVHTAPQ